MKRRVDDDYGDQGKRQQLQRIHTEAHQRTVALMMALARYLSTPDSSQESEDEAPQSSFHQRPFWPQITRVVN